MPKFDVFVKNKKIKVQKNTSSSPSSMAGFDYLGSLIGSTKINALSQANTKFKNGFWKMPVKKREDNVIIEDSFTFPPVSDTPKKAIICDFNGVLDDKERERNATNSIHSPAFYLPEIACPHKIYKVIKLAIDNNASLVMSSLWRTSGVDYSIIVNRCLKTSGIEEYIQFYNDNRRKIKELCRVMSTPISSAERTEQIRELIINEEYTHFVVFEDDHFIEKDLNPVMVQSSVGLLDEHIEKAQVFLNY